LEVELPDLDAQEDALGALDEWQDTLDHKLSVGELSSRSVRGDFLVEFYARLEEGTSEEWIAEVVEEGYEQVYVVKGDMEMALSKWERRLIKSYRKVEREQWQEKLLSLHSSLHKVTQDREIRQFYLRQIQNELQTLISAGHVSKPTMTPTQLKEVGWKQLIDVEATVASGMVMLPYEQLAHEVLGHYKRHASAHHLTLNEALAPWKLSRLERNSLDLEGNETELSETQGCGFFRLLLKRLGLEKSWLVKVGDGRHSLEVDSGARTLWYPQGRRLSGEDILSVTFHEMVHVVGSENGALQKSSLMQNGVSGYLETEEGIATCAEALGKLPFGNIRQAVMAGRYVAVAMALKARRVEGALEPVYSMQDIYERLIDYRIPQEMAAKTVWRAFRGTSLTHQAMELELETVRGKVALPIAECFVRDSVYFRGFVKMIGWFEGGG
jgi:hypothetical protein